MLASIRSEFRKLLTVRSTYIFVLISCLMIMLFAFYGEGVKYNGPTDNPFHLHRQIIESANALVLFTALIGVLLMTHEYRYNTIMYTLTASNSRTKTLLAKFIVVSTCSIILTLFYAVLAPAVAALGLKIGGTQMVEQVFYFKDIFWRLVLFGWGIAMLALIIAVIIRNQIGAIVAILILPTTVEPLIGALLKGNQVYLPISLFGLLLSGEQGSMPITYARAAVVGCIYIVVGWLIAWLLFLRRDAN